MQPIRRVACWSIISGALLASRLPAQENAPAQPAASTPPAPNAPQNAAAPEAAPASEQERLLDRLPFDRITLKEGNAVVETVLLDFPNRQVPDPLPTTGQLELRRLSHPSIPYKAEWSAIGKVELYEHMLLEEANRLTAAGEFGEAFDYLAYLSSNYPQLAGLEAARQEHLWREASTAYSSGKREEAWPVLVALYGRNPEFPRLTSAVQAVSDELITRRLADKNYAGAGALLDALEKELPKLQLPNVATWRQRFETDAAAQLARARTALAAKNYTAAREAVNYARSILPTIAGGDQLWREIQESSPEIRVGVTQAGTRAVAGQVPDWAACRLSDLIDPTLVELVDFSAEGGVYASRWGEILPSDSGIDTTVRLSPPSLAHGILPSAVAMQLLSSSSPSAEHTQNGLAALLARLQTVDGRDVKITWRRPHVRPEAFLQIPLRELTSASQTPGAWFEPPAVAPGEKELKYARTGNNAAAGPRDVVELLFDDDEAATAALLAGNIDALDRVPPWQLASLKRVESIVVAQYRLPTVHALVVDLEHPLLAMREFRRALDYGIDDESIVRDIFLAGQSLPGYRTLSGPFLAGVSLNDPAGYGYNAEVKPRPYEPRLAALLAGVARSTLAKRDAEVAKQREAAKKKAEPPAKEGEQPAAEAKQPAEDQTAAANGDGKAADAPTPEPALPPMKPLVLAHPPDPLARLACQTIKLQLDGIGIPIQLLELPQGQSRSEVKCDLAYVELAAWEPIYDARRLLGPGGVAGQSGALIGLALAELDRAENWNQARAQLKEIHRIFHYDLPMLPLWQTVNHFGYRKEVAGVGASPVRLYQNLAQWRK